MFLERALTLDEIGIYGGCLFTGKRLPENTKRPRGDVIDLKECRSRTVNSAHSSTG